MNLCLLWKYAHLYRKNFLVTNVMLSTGEQRGKRVALFLIPRILTEYSGQRTWEAFELWSRMQLDWDFRIQPPRWVVHFETTGSISVLLCLQQESSFIWNIRSETDSKIFYFSISTQSLHITVKTCFSKRCFLLILVHRRICSIRYLPLLWCFWVLNK